MWEALTALGTLLSAAVIAVTVLLTARQVRITANQLDHLRRATQLEGAMRIFADLTSPEFSEAQRFVLGELAEKMKDPQFSKEVASPGSVDLKVHKEMLVGRTMERIGAYVRHRLIDGDIIMDVSGQRIVNLWLAMRAVVAMHRHVGGAQMWENFEYLYERTIAFGSQRGSPYRTDLVDASALPS